MQKKNISKKRIWPFRSIKKIVLDVGEAFEKQGEILEIKGLPVRTFAFRHPDDIETIFKHPLTGIRKYDQILPRVKWVMGQGGYIQQGGDAWQQRRRVVNPAFKMPCLRGYLAEYPLLVSQMLKKWESEAGSGRSFDLCGDLQRLIIQANFQMFFSHSLNDAELSQVVADTHFVQLHFVRPSPLLLPLPGNIKFRQSVGRLRTKMKSILSARKEGGEEKNDLLTFLLKAEQEEGWSENDQIGEIFSVYFGAAVVATTLAWHLYLLAAHPSSQERVVEEVARVLKGTQPTVSDFPKLKFIQAAMAETTRLFPPSWGYPRYCLEGLQVGRHAIPPKSLLLPMVYFAQRHPEYWDNVEAFWPDRFLAEAAKTRHPYAHLPFGAGRRFCLGSQLAPMLIAMTSACIFQKLRLQFCPRFTGDPVADFGFEIHPADQIRVKTEWIR